MGFIGKLLGLLDRKSLARRQVKVMILNPAKGVVTDYWDYDKHKDLIEKWVGSDGTLYMMCVYKDGSPEYYAVNKNLFNEAKQRLGM